MSAPMNGADPKCLCTVELGLQQILQSSIRHQCRTSQRNLEIRTNSCLSWAAVEEPKLSCHNDIYIYIHILIGFPQYSNLS